MLGTNETFVKGFCKQPVPFAQFHVAANVEDVDTSRARECRCSLCLLELALGWVSFPSGP